MKEDLSQWKEIASLLNDALPEIDKLLSQANVPISQRKVKAFDIVRETMLEVSDEKAFLVSDAHGRFLVAIEEWYRSRYGRLVDKKDHETFGTLVIIHDTPFEMHVPKTFRLPPDDEHNVWMGFPGSVQPEEDPLNWIVAEAVVKALPKAARAVLQPMALQIANLARCIVFDLRALEYDNDIDVADLAGAIGSDLQASARHLCEQNLAGLRSSGWDVSQATEKALKLFIRCNGEKPPFTHNLASLADFAERLGASVIDRSALAKIPSGRDATDMRYGGDLTLYAATEAYLAGLKIVCQLLLEATPKSKYNVRELRLQLRLPPWFQFDIEAFRAALREKERAL